MFTCYHYGSYVIQCNTTLVYTKYCINITKHVMANYTSHSRWHRCSRSWGLCVWGHWSTLSLNHQSRTL